eukprot:1138804-Pelagomonas_calceolata.AAC.1
MLTDGVGLTAVGGKRRLDETELTATDGTLKRQPQRTLMKPRHLHITAYNVPVKKHLEEESADGVQCHLCAELVKQGRSKVRCRAVQHVGRLCKYLMLQPTIVWGKPELAAPANLGWPEKNWICFVQVA